MNNILLGICVAMAALCAPASADAKLDLHLPVDCAVGTTCFIQNYMDHDPAKDVARDYTCGSLTYDGHKGTDFRVSSYAQLQAGVNILATAKGEVSYLRTQPEIEPQDIPLLKLIKLGMHSNCGSTIRINHGTGWESTYCHMDPKGFTVIEGDKVEQGQVIGRMGTSGITQFPHVHYELRHYSNPVDPFVGYAGSYDCTTDKRYSQWEAQVAEQLQYMSLGVVTAGFSNEMPTAPQARYGVMYDAELDMAEPEIYFGLEIYGMRQYDILTMQIMAPDGGLLAKKKITYDKPYALVFETLSVERKKDEDAWPEGRYQAYVTLDRFENVLKETIINRQWQVDMVKK